MAALSIKDILTKHEASTAVRARLERFRSKMAFLATIPARDLVKLRKLSLVLAVKWKPHTMLSYPRLSNLYEITCALEREGITGSFVECGVWRGGSAALVARAAELNKHRHHWLFDSWEGLPEPGVIDVTVTGRKGLKGRDLAPEENVRDLLFRRFRLSEENIHLVKGWFNHTLPAYKKTVGPIALLHIDGDWYESVKICLEELYDNVARGGFVVIDDYGFWQGCNQAVNEFVEKHKIELKTIPYAGPEKVECEGAYFRKF